MAVTDAYFTAAEYRTAVSKTDTGDDAQIALDATSVSRMIERKVGRFFTKDAAVVARIYLPDHLAGSDGRTLLTDDIASKTGLVVKIDTDRDGVFTDETALTLATDYLLEPENAEFGPEAAPWTRIRLVEWGAYREWPQGKRVQVTAIFGWPAVPAAVKRGAIDLTAILRLESPRARREFIDIDRMVETSKEAQRIVTDLVRVYRKMRAF